MRDRLRDTFAPRGARAVRFAATALLLWGTLLGCGARAADESVRVELAALLPDADAERPLRVMDFRHPQQKRFRSAGWNPERKAPAGGFAWTRGRDAVVELPIVRPQPLSLQLEVGGGVKVRGAARPSRGGRPTQMLRVLWNGHDLGNHEIQPGPPRTLRLRVEPGLQRVGPNRLDLLPRYWSRDDLGSNTPERQPGVRVHSLRLEATDPELRAPGDVARGEGQDIVQAAGTVVSLGLPLPAAARLRGGLGLEGATPAGGLVTVSLLDERGDARELGAWPAAELAGPEPLAIDLEVGGSAGDLAVLSLAFSLRRSERGAGGGALPSLRWSGLRLEGRAPAAPAPIRPRLEGPLNVLVVLFDALRADHTEPYDAQRVKTPNLARLASRGVTLVNATANASWTRASVASLLTGLHPATHRVTAIGDALPAEAPFLPALLKAAGYTTVGLVDNPQVGESYGFARGFEVHVGPKQLERPAEGEPEAYARSVWERYLGPVLEDAARRPFFVYLHGIDPHAPYEPPPPFDSLYGFGYQGNLSTSGQTLRERTAMLGLLQHGDEWLDEADIRHLRSQYAGEVTYMDRFLGWILERLDALDLTRRTLVVFVSDHGEEFLEHGSWGHGASVYQRSVEIPMLLSLPGVLPEGRRVHFPAQLSDLPPTVLDLLGLPRPEGLGGRSLLPYLLGGREEELGGGAETDRAVFTHSLPKAALGGGYKVGIRYRDWKLVRDSQRPGASARGYRLFALGDDPDERIDRWATVPAAGLALRQMLDRYERAAAATGPRRTPAAPDEETGRALRALGYLE